MIVEGTVPIAMPEGPSEIARGHTMPHNDSHTFKTSLVWTGDRMGKFTRDDRPPLEGSTPPEFGGPAGQISVMH